MTINAIIKLGCNALKSARVTMSIPQIIQR